MAIPDLAITGQPIPASEWNDIRDELMKIPQAGTKTLTLTSESQKTASVLFPRAFAVAPIVTVSCNFSAFNAYWTSATTTGVTVGVRERADTNTTATITVHWHAQPATT